MSTPPSTPSSPTPSASQPSPAATCPRCARPIPANAVLGACPHCLLAAGLTSEPAAPANSAPPPTPAELAPEFPQLEILELLGRGGMGAVYKARQKSLDRLVALKLLRPGLDADPSFAERFTREARALAQLNHPGIVTLYEFGRTPGGLFFILMEFVDGLNLRQLLAAGRLSPREALAIIPPLCDALQYAHDRGLVHRDIKPENILIDRLGRVKIADFGLAKLAATSAPLTDPKTLSASASDPSSPLTLHSSHTADSGTDHRSSLTGHSVLLTETGKVIGTPEYMSPEQRAHPDTVDHRADIYALGVVLYQMLTGELPDSKQLQPPSHRVQLDIRLDQIVLRALEANPSLRYTAASELKTQIETFTRPGDLSRPNATATTPPVTMTAPRALKIVAALFIGCGVYGLLRIVLKDSGPVPFVFKNSLIAVPLGLGLWHMRPGSYRAAQIALGLVFACMLVWGTLVFTPLPRLLEDNFTSISVPSSIYEESRGLKGAINVFNLVSFSALLSWMWMVLKRPAIAALFKQSPALHSPDSSDPHRIFRIVALTFAALCTLHLAWAFSTADELPARVASHFGMNSRADGYMSKTGYLIFICAFPLGLGLLLQGSALLVRWLPDKYINVPHRAIWLAPARRPQLIAILQAWFATLSCGLVIFSAEMHTLTLLAHRLYPIRLPDIALFTLIGFPSILMLWAIGLLLRLAEPNAEPRHHTRRSLILAIVSIALLGFFAAPTVIAWQQRQPSYGATVSLPSTATPHRFPNDPIRISKDGNYFIGATQVSLEALHQHVTTLGQQTPAPTLRIKADGRTAYPKIATLMSEAKKRGVTKISFDTGDYEPDEMAQTAPYAKSWLQQIDDGHYTESWVASSPLFRVALSERDWITTLGSVRAPLGAMLSRFPFTAETVEKLPGVSGGPHIVFRFATRFENKLDAVETVTFTRDTDSIWRASGYFIK